MKASDNEFPSVILEEVANDGSATGTPAADHRRLFLGEDGMLHVKDSAGVVTEPYTGASEITDIATSEMDDSLVLAPDGAGGVEFRAEAGGSGGAVYPFDTNFFHETKPGSANATYDDEFDDTTGMSGTSNGLDARWNWRNQGTATATFPNAGWLTLSAPAASSSNWRIIENTAFADGTYEAKLSMECALNNDTAGGIIIIDGTNGDFFLIGFTAESGTRYLGVQKWTNVTTWSANTQRTAIPLIKTLAFVKVTKSSTSIGVWFSEDGVGWINYYNFTEDVSATRIGLGVNDLTNTTKTKLHVDYFRKTA